MKQSHRLFYVAVFVLKGDFMVKYRFVIIGSGWRSLYYVRIAKALPEVFELCAMLCRTEEKASKMSEEYGIHTTVSADECERYNPDFVVVVVNKSSIADVSMDWMKKGFTVLCETPAAIKKENLNEIWELHERGCKLVVAEQYTRYPVYSAMIKTVNKHIIGSPNFMNISLAHGYHGISLMRALLEIDSSEQFSVYSRVYEYPTVETYSRYEKFTDGHTAQKKRNIAIFEFESGKTAVFDFDSEQYRSPIRNNSYKIQGCKGEMMGNKIYYLDDNNNPITLSMDIKSRELTTENDNPNLHTVKEIIEVSLGKELLYEPYFGQIGLAEDETSIALLMKETAEYSRGNTSEPYALADALQDAYASLLMEESENKGIQVKSRVQAWN